VPDTFVDLVVLLGALVAVVVAKVGMGEFSVEVESVALVAFVFFHIADLLFKRHFFFLLLLIFFSVIFRRDSDIYGGTFNMLGCEMRKRTLFLHGHLIFFLSVLIVVVVRNIRHNRII